MYVSLHNRTAYSFGSALTMPGELAAFAREQGMPAVALTDLHGLYAAVEFQEACREAGVRPIFGVELSPADGPGVTLLAMTLRGYGNLCRLISRHHVQGVTTAGLREYAEDVICMIGDARASARDGGPARRHGLAAGLDDRARMCNNKEPRASTCAAASYKACRGVAHDDIDALRDAFAGRLYVELAIHRPEDVPEARRRAARADAAGIPVVAACASRCLRREQMPTLRALASIGTLTLLDRSHPDKPEGVWHLRAPAEMARLFRRRPDALANTLRIADRCDVRLDLGRNRFPKVSGTICAGGPDRGGIRILTPLCVAGCRQRYVERPPQKGMGGRRPTLAEALRRLDRELAVIEQVHYADYFLVFHEIVQYCRSQGIATLARGSAADSLVCYALGVSHACPFRFDLPFDRFLNAERAKFSKMADIDLDLPWDQRDQVIRWVYDRWGHDRVAMIGAPNTFHARAAVADLGKVFGLPPHEIHQVTKRLPRTAAENLPRYLAESPEAREVPADEEPYATILRMAAELDDLPRHWSMHPCGLVVSPEPLTDLVPVQPSPKGPLVSQYDMDAIEALGFIKIDLLGQAGLSVLRDAVTEIERTDGKRVNLEEDVDYADRPTWDLIACGNARGVHHIESPAMTSLLQQCACRDIDCLTAIVAIIRPGAANQGKKDAFARRHTSVEPPHYAHPTLRHVLEKTYGLMVFEEHILQIATEFAGMNLGEADVLRRGLNKEKRDLILRMKARFVEGARGLGRSEQAIAAVWSQVEGFAGFMFNKAHSAEYAVEAFQGAWLKLRRPAHYLAAILSNYRGFYAHSPTLPQILYVMEALRMGIRLLPPCVHRSRRRFSVEEAPAARPAIRIPVSHIQGLSEATVERYHAEHDRGAFAAPEDFIERCRPGAAEALALLDSGAFDGFGLSRPELFWRLKRHRVAGGLFGESAAPPWSPAGVAVGPDAFLKQQRVAPTPDAFAPPIELTSPDARQIAGREMELLGFPVSMHPLDYLGGDDQGRGIDWSRFTPVERLAEHAGERVHVCGLMVADRVNGTLGGGLMKFVTLADRTGFVETILFPDVYRRFGHLTVAHPILAAAGVVEPFETGTGLTFRVLNVQPPGRQ